MYDGLQDAELRPYHKRVKFSINLFLADILESNFRDFFLVETVSGFVHITPLFYTDTISTDSDDVIVINPYKIIVPEGYDGLLTFHGDDGQVVESKRKYVNEDLEGYVTVLVFNAKTREFLPEQEYLVEYPNYPVQRLVTGSNGYGGFIKLEDGYNVVVL